MSRLMRSEADLVGRKEEGPWFVVAQRLEGKDTGMRAVRPTGMIIRGMLGICDGRVTVAVKVEESFVKRDEWKMGAWWDAATEEEPKRYLRLGSLETKRARVVTKFSDCFMFPFGILLVPAWATGELDPYEASTDTFEDTPISNDLLALLHVSRRCV